MAICQRNASRYVELAKGNEETAQGRDFAEITAQQAENSMGIVNPARGALSSIASNKSRKLQGRDEDVNNRALCECCSKLELPGEFGDIWPTRLLK